MRNAPEPEAVPVTETDREEVNLGHLFPDGVEKAEYKGVLKKGFAAQVGASDRFGYEGKASITVTPTAIRLESTGKGLEKLLSNFKPVELPWGALREVKNRVSDKGFFIANFGADKGDELVRRVVLDKRQDVSLLSTLLDGLPEEARAQRCPRCGGSVVGGTCNACGRNPSSANRKQGLIMLIGGIVLFAVGAALLGASESGSQFAFFLAGIGLITALYGLVKTVLGLRM